MVVPSAEVVSKTSVCKSWEVLTISTDERLDGRYSTSEESNQVEGLHDEAALVVRREGKGVDMA